MKFVTTEKMASIMDEVETLDDLYENQRGHDRKPMTQDARQTFIKIGALMKEYWDISLKINEDWHQQEPLWKKKFIS